MRFSDINNNYYNLDLIPAMGENGEIWEIPISTSIINTVLYMNRELVNSLGFSTPKTYQDLVDMVPKARAAGLHIVSINGIDGWTWGSCLLSCIIARMSGDAHWVSKAVAGQRKFTDKAFIDSLTMISQMIKDGVISQETLHFDYGTNINNYNTEKALFMVQGLWAAAVSPGYGLTKKGASNPAVREAGIRFLKYFNSYEAVTQRIRDGLIFAPVLKNYQIPEDLSPLMKQRIKFSWKAINTEVIDIFLRGEPNDVLNAGIQKIVDGEATPYQIAAEIERLLRN